MNNSIAVVIAAVSAIPAVVKKPREVNHGAAHGLFGSQVGPPSRSGNFSKRTW
ncbi:MAG TPA: hypothetical protein PLT55_02880 [Acidimicrobiia bacterium]|nr:hypothetical protein [Acidimicrobiia bacterium]